MTDFRIAAVFSDNMVLQRNAFINVFGEGNNGEVVTVSFDGAEARTRISDGKWLVRLPKHEAGENYTMSVRCGAFEKTFANVAVGEVWLAGGQSNMELELQNCKTGKDSLENDKNPNVRFYYTQKKCYIDDEFLESEKNTCWSEFDSESARCWSAVGYYFAKELAKRLGVIVGVIGCNWGGTSASYWMSRESLERDVDTKAYLDDYDNAIEGKSFEELKKAYEEYVEYDRIWNEKSAKYYAETPNPDWEDCQRVCGKNLYPGPHSPLNPFHATALYDTMFKRVCPYTIKGVIWYQGETDDSRPRTYFKLFKNMIQLWRDDYENDELAFVFVQLPMHRYSADADHKHWCLIREAQERTAKTVRNTAMAVIIDCGEFNEIHPKDKLPVGNRLCLQALYNIYGDKSVEKEAFSPLYKEMEITDEGILLSFDHCDGFEVKGELSGFEIAGADKKFITADAELRGDKIFVSEKSVAEPLFVRYLWTNYSEVTLFGKNGLPVAPFRTSREDEI